MVSEFTSMPSRREGEIHLGAQPNDLTVSAFELSDFPFSFYFTAQPSGDSAAASRDELSNEESTKAVTARSV